MNMDDLTILEKQEYEQWRLYAVLKEVYDVNSIHEEGNNERDRVGDAEAGDRGQGGRH